MVDKIQKFYGFQSSISRPDYQRILDMKAKSVFGDNKTLTFEEFLKKEPEITIAFNKTDEEGQRQINNMLSKVFRLDGDNSTININEYKTLMAVIDAKDTPGKTQMSMDSQFDIDEHSGIFSLHDDVNIYYNKLKWKNMSKNDIIKEMQTNVQNTINSNIGGNGNNQFKLHDIMTTIAMYYTESGLGSTMTFEDVIKCCCGNDIVSLSNINSNAYPNATPTNYSKSSNLYYSKTLGGKPTVIEIDMHNKKCQYYCEENGSSVCFWENADMLGSRTLGSWK